MSNSSAPTQTGYVTITLHAHLPYVINHGTWPHGLEWLHEAAAETYLPLLKAFAELEQQNLALKANLNLSPILLEQLAHPVFLREFPAYLLRKIEAAKKDALEFNSAGDEHAVEVAGFWKQFYEQALGQFENLGGSLIRGFQHFYDAGAIEIITCGATHGYFPLLGSDASIRAQVKLGVETHRRFFGRKPRGIWLPECGYRPAGNLQFPVPVNGSQPFLRAGVEQILAENEIEYFFVDTHLVDTATHVTPYDLRAGKHISSEEWTHKPVKSFYRAYYADTPGGQQARVAFFTRDPRTGVQVWSGEDGYPGDPNYLEFHKKRWPGGNRYWRITGPKVDLGDKLPYYPELARARTLEHAAHFASITAEALATQGGNGPGIPILTAPFDAELFGHWWFEGVEWLKNVAVEFNRPESKVRLVTCGEYLDAHPPAGHLALPEGSWGANSDNSVWLNKDTSWTWKDIYPAEAAVLKIVNGGLWRGKSEATRLVQQICRELLLLESSDWQFLITTQAARDYAEKRFHTHHAQLNTLLETWRCFESTGRVPPEKMLDLENIEQRDSVFLNIDPRDWAPR
ncbi:MAG: DUF1957 domain-containing protein [Acidobacteriia bacterium]|nr:DUF1957 domain-containing protein [Terriglobia bacterium]